LIDSDRRSERIIIVIRTECSIVSTAAEMSSATSARLGLGLGKVL